MAFGLERYELTGFSRRIAIPEISADPAKPFTLIVRAASEGNREYRNALFAAGSSDADQKADRQSQDSTAMDRLGRLLAGTVIVGWENVFDDGRPLAFSDEVACRLIIELLTRVRDVWNARVVPVIYAEPNEFRKPADPVELGKG